MPRYRTAVDGADPVRRWYAACSPLDMNSKPPARQVLTMVALTCAYSPPDLATDKPLHGRMDQYGRTLNALELYRALAAQDDGSILPEIEKPIEAGDHYDGLPRLIRLLRLLGDLPSDADCAESDLYQGVLVTAVQRFQARHGLEHRTAESTKRRWRN